MRILHICVLLAAVLCLSCEESRTAIIWTDRSEFALYGEYFNTAQNQYKVSVRYVEFPSTELGKSNSPDIVAASWLKNSSTSVYFRTLDSLFGAKKLSRNIFYPRLFTIGSIDRKQYLLPVSFNIPALIFSRDYGNDLSNQFTVDFEEMKKLSKNYNIMTRGAYTRMGFSPRWNENFLLITSVLHGAAFKEEDPLGWNANALEDSMIFVNNWTNEINSNMQLEDDFFFKYFFEPPEKLIQSGRILFSYMESCELFTLSEEKKRHLDFRWVINQNNIPVTEDSVYIGIPKKAKSQEAARAFIQWFFKVENQRLLLEHSRAYRTNENTFGICGGFSSLTSVTEHIYPLFYPELLGRMPPSENFMLHNMLPGNWMEIKKRVVLPYLSERARSENLNEANTLERRLSDWMRMNR